MTVLDTFFIKFKGDSSNALDATKKVQDATKALQKTNEELLAVQEALGKKVGKNLTDQEKQEKHLQEVKKKQFQEVRAAEKEQEQRDKEKLKVGNEFVSIVEKATAAAAAYFSLAALSNGLFNSAQTNSDLKVQSDLLNQNVESVKALDAAGRAAGGSSGGILAQFAKIFHEQSAHGLTTADIETLNRRYHDLLKEPRYQSPKARDQFFQQNGITDVGQQSLLLKSDADFEKQIAFNKSFTASSKEGIQAGRDFQEAMSNFGAATNSVFTELGSRALPTLTELTGEIIKFDKYLNEHPHMADALAAGITILAGALSAGAVAGIVGGLGAIGAAAVAVAAPFAALTAGIGGAAFVISQHKNVADWIDNKLHGKEDAEMYSRIRKGFTTNSKKSSSDSVAFWMSQGYSREQAAGIAANEARESGGNPNARGDGGLASGLYQWHPDRVASILKGTGIDVRAASAEDQRRAAAWELKHLGLDSGLRNITGADNAAAYFSNKFERPANGAQESLIRGQSALGIANKSIYGMTPIPGSSNNSKSVSIKVGDVNVHTQATNSEEIARNVSNELSRQLNHVTANADNGLLA